MQISTDELQIIAQHRPAKRSEQSLMRAAIAIILREGEQGTEFLLMQRATHEHDPWSGQMSFPGGKIEPEDESAMAAAVREAEEEVGLRLSEDDYIGRLDDLYGLKVDNQYSVHVACFVFKPLGEMRLKANHEVADLLWLPFRYLDDRDNNFDYYHPRDQNAKMPAVLIDADKDQILWGLSLRMLSTFYELLDWPLRVLSEEENLQLKQIEKRNIDSSKMSKSPADKFSRFIIDRRK